MLSLNTVPSSSLIHFPVTTFDTTVCACIAGRVGHCALTRHSAAIKKTLPNLDQLMHQHWTVTMASSTELRALRALWYYIHRVK